MADDFAQRFNQLLVTKQVQTFGPMTLQVKVHLSATETRDISVGNLYPFMTVNDLKMAILTNDVVAAATTLAAPEFVFLATQRSEFKHRAHVFPLAFYWSTLDKPPVNLLLKNPFAAITADEVDARFVDGAGERRTVYRTPQDRLTLEDVLGATGTTVLVHCFLYESVKAAYRGAQPISQREWNGRFYPYFPALSNTRDTLSPQQRAVAETKLAGFSAKQEMLQKLQTVLTVQKTLTPIQLNAVKYMQLTFDSVPDDVKAAFPGIETVFYETPVTARLPYIRYMPAEGTPVSKIHLNQDSKPDIPDPRLLLQWSQERTLFPNRNFASAKLLVREAAMNIPPIYATLSLCDDATANVTIQPPKAKAVRKLDVVGEMDQLGGPLAEGLRSFKFLRGFPKLTRSVFLYSMTVTGRSEQDFSGETLRRKLANFQPIFQEIPPLPDEGAHLMLRYKLVSNFVSLDRMRAFISQFRSRNLLRDTRDLVGLPQIVQKEFDVGEEEARKAVVAAEEASTDFVQTDSNDVILNQNTGVDIAVFASHPNYSFHIYNNASEQTLKRILTFLGLLFTYPAESFAVAATTVASAVKAEEVVSKEVEAEVNAGEESEEEEGFEEADDAEEEAEGKEEDAEAAEEGFEEAEDAEEDAEAAEEGFEEAEEEAKEEAAAAAAAAPRPEPDEIGFDDAVPDYLLDIMGADDTPTLEEAARRNSVRASAREGAALPDRPGASAVLETTDAVAAEQGLRQHIREEAVGAAVLPPKRLNPVEKHRMDTGQLPKQAGGAPKKKVREGPPPLDEYFSRKLKEADRRLFEYEKLDASIESGYVSKCQANLGKQPSVFTEEKFEEMKRLYADVPGLKFVVYPLEKDDKVPTDPKGEYYTMLKYGSSELKHYFICSQYYCVRDEVMIRAVEFEGTRRRIPGKGLQLEGTKPANTCPLCLGTLVTNRKFPGVNETVLERQEKSGSKKRHTFIGFLRKQDIHPEGLQLPCCFLEDHPIRKPHYAFPETAAAAAAAAAVPEDETEAKEMAYKEAAAAALGAPPAAPAARAAPAVPAALSAAASRRTYSEVLYEIRYTNILGDEKMPLEGATARLTKTKKDEPSKLQWQPPQIGLLPPNLSKYFNQENSLLTKRRQGALKLNTNAMGMLRIGVENRARFLNDSFLAATAPLFGKNTVKEFKEHLLDIITPRLFLALNFGNLLMEFYKPTDGLGVDAAGEPMTVEKVIKWANDNIRLGRALIPMNKQSILRIYKSYHRFRNWLKSAESVKEYRHFCHLFSLPALLRQQRVEVAETGEMREMPERPGIALIVLEQDKAGNVHVRCPSYPMNQVQLETMDFAFLFHHSSGFWEPLVYVDNRSPDVRGPTPFAMTLNRVQLSRGAFPPILKERINQFIQRCTEGNLQKPQIRLGFVTSQSDVKVNSLYPMSRIHLMLKKSDTATLVGILRDSYNHIAALVYKYASKSLIPVPVVEGTIKSLFDLQPYINIEVKVYLDWDELATPSLSGSAATPAEMIEFFKKILKGTDEPDPDYQVRKVILSKGRVKAVRLGNGMVLPASQPKAGVPIVPPTYQGAVKVEENNEFEFEWTTNKRIACEDQAELIGQPCVQLSQDAARMQLLREKEFTEVYEHLRITFSNWLATDERGKEFRTRLDSILFPPKRERVSVAEQRKEIFILISPVVLDWLTERSADEEPREMGILRTDCLLRSKDECSGACKWIDSGASGKCLIHVPAETPHEGADGHKASARLILLRRLVDELLLFANRRKQILERRVSRLAILNEAIRIQDQYILPEKSNTWFELLRLEWAKKEVEKPKFMEEMTETGIQAAPAAAAQAPAADVAPVPAPPPPAAPAMTAPVPELVRTLFKIPDSSEIAIKYSSNRTFNPLLKGIGIDVKPKPLGVLNEDSLKEFARMPFLSESKIRLVYLDITNPEKAIFISKRLPLVKYTTFYILLKLQDGMPAILVKNAISMDPKFAFNELPPELQDKFRASIPAAPAPPTAAPPASP